MLCSQFFSGAQEIKGSEGEFAPDLSGVGKNQPEANLQAIDDAVK